MAILVMVVGDKIEAAKAAADRGIPVVFGKEEDPFTLGVVSEDFLPKLEWWFSEDWGSGVKEVGSLYDFISDLTDAQIREELSNE